MDVGCTPRRLPYRNLPDDLRPASIAEAYAAQEAYYRLAEPVYGAVAGAKIATTTKVMQQLMGITIRAAARFLPAPSMPRRPLRIADFVNLRIESEIALKLGADLPASGAPWTRERSAPAVAGAMPAFELIEDRNADYTKTEASSLIVENCWNGGVVVGRPKPASGAAWSALPAGSPSAAKPSAKARRRPCATLAWLANISPNAAATSKPAWSSSPAASFRRFRSRPASARCLRSRGWATS